MQDMRMDLEKLLNGSDECTLISKLATDEEKQRLFQAIAGHLKLLADHVAVTMKLRGAREPNARSAIDLSRINADVGTTQSHPRR